MWTVNKGNTDAFPEEPRGSASAWLWHDPWRWHIAKPTVILASFAQTEVIYRFDSVPNISLCSSKRAKSGLTHNNAASGMKRSGSNRKKKASMSGRKQINVKLLTSAHPTKAHPTICLNIHEKFQKENSQAARKQLFQLQGFCFLL